VAVLKIGLYPKGTQKCSFTYVNGAFSTIFALP